MVDDELENKPLVEVYDTLLIPVLALAETDWNRGELDEGKHRFILQSLQEMIHETGEAQEEMEAKEGIDDGASPLPYVLCLPARNEADEIAGMMLAQLSATRECRVQSVSYTASAGEVVQLVEGRKPDVSVHFRHASRRRDACSPPLQARSWSISGSTRGRGIVERGRRFEQSENAHWWRRRNARRGDVGGSAKN